MREGQGDHRHDCAAALRLGRRVAAIVSASASVRKVRCAFRVGLRIITAEMAAAAFLARQRRRRDQLARRRSCSAARVRRRSRVRSTQIVASAAVSPSRIALQPHMARHRFAQHSAAAAAAAKRSGAGGVPLPRPTRDAVLHVFGDARAEHQRFQQRIGGKPIGAVQPRRGAFADRPQAVAAKSGRAHRVAMPPM